MKLLCERIRTVATALGFGGLSVGVCVAEVDLASLSLDQLMEVEVTTPGKVPEAIRDTPASIYLVTRDDIETFGYRDLTDVLGHVPGFYNVDNYTGASGNFGIRGFWNGRSQNSSVAILVNGVPQMRPDLFATPMEGINVPVEAIDRVEVSRGPNSVIYGNGAFIGAINIITDGSFSDDQFSVSTGSNGSHRVAGRFSEFGDDYHLIVNAGFSRTDGHEHDLLDMVGPLRSALLPVFGVSPDNSSLDGRLEREGSFFQISAAWRQFSIDYTVNQSEVEAFSGFPSVEGGNLRDSRIDRIMFGTDLPFGDFDFNTRLTYTSFENEERFDALYPGFFGVNTRDFDNWELESLLTYDAGDSIRFLAGVNLQRLQNFLEFTDVPDVGLINESVVVDSRDLHSLFAQVNYEISETWNLVAGYRVEEMSGFDRFVFVDEPLDGTPLPGGPKGGFKNGTPRVSLIYQPNDAQVLKFMVGDATKIPYFNDPGFDTEKSRTAEVNYTWARESTLFSLSVFKNTLSDLMVETLEVSPTAAVDFRRLRGGRADTDGLELLVRKEFMDTLRGEVGFTWQDSERAENPDGTLSYSPELVAHGKLSYNKGDFTASLLGRYVGGMESFYNREASGSPLVTRGYFGDAAEGYFVGDVNLRWDDLWQNGFLNLRVSNVLDTEIRYASNPINGLLLDRGTIGQGRRFDFSAGLRF